MSFKRPFLLDPVFFRTALPCSGGYHLERSGINCKKGATTENQGADVNSIDIPGVAARAVRWLGNPKVARSRLTQCSKSCDLQRALHCAIRGAQWGTTLCRVGGATSQLDLPSLTPLSIAGCGRLQLGAPHWATSVNYASS